MISTNINADDNTPYFDAGDFQKMKQKRGSDKRLNAAGRKAEQQYRKARKQRHWG